MTRIAYLDMFGGISGDMLLGALIDAGVSLSEVQEEIDEKLPIEAEITAKKVKRRGITARKVAVNFEEESEERSLSDVRKLIEESRLNQEVKEGSKRVFEALGKAEARVHDLGLDEVHFHEVGAVDSIVDVVASVMCLQKLRIEEIYYSDFKVGSGTIQIEHGRYPIPAPATVELLKGQRMIRLDVKSELTTPTGVALATTLGRQGFPPAFELDRIGYGAGKEKLDRPNVLRVEIGSTSKDSAEDVWLVETNIDDMNPELYERSVEKLLERGALDVWLTPITMKRGRPGILLSVISPLDEEKLQGLIDTIYRETSSIGVRRRRMKRDVLAREMRSVGTKYGKVEVKVAFKEGKIVNVAPEYRQCVELSERNDVPLKRVYREAISEASKQLADLAD